MLYSPLKILQLSNKTDKEMEFTEDTRWYYEVGGEEVWNVEK